MPTISIIVGMLNSRHRLAWFISPVVLSLGIAVVTAGGALAATASPSALYVPEISAGLCGSSSQDQAFWSGSGATGSYYDDRGDNNVTATSGDTVTIYNECASTTLYVDGGDGVRSPGIAPGASAVITISGSRISAYNGTDGLASLMAAAAVVSGASSTTTTAPATPETPAPTLPVTGQQTVLVGAAALLIGLGALATLIVRRRRDLSAMAQAVRHP